MNRKAGWYLDLTGSGKPKAHISTAAHTPEHVSPAPGNETMSHLYEPGNGRMTILFEAFEGPPRILRLFGRGERRPLPTALSRL